MDGKLHSMMLVGITLWSKCY